MKERRKAWEGEIEREESESAIFAKGNEREREIRRKRWRRREKGFFHLDGGKTDGWLARHERRRCNVGWLGPK